MKEIKGSFRPRLGGVWPTVLLAAKTYGKGVLNPLLSSVFAHVRADCIGANFGDMPAGVYSYIAQP
jgi:hypothetical protein